MATAHGVQLEGSSDMRSNGASSGKSGFVDSSSFYDELAEHYDLVAAERRPYLDTVDRLLRTRWTGVRRMLDIGCGDGARVGRLAGALGVEDLWLTDNSAEMVRRAGQTVPNAEVRQVDVSDNEQCRALEGGVDLVTCLGNIFGHMSAQQRLEGLRNLRGLLAPDGAIFLDLNNRYNVAQYGVRRVLVNVFADLVGRGGGDFHTTRLIDGRAVTTPVHLTHHGEVTELVGAAGLHPRATWFAHYGDGRLVRTPWRGQIVMELRNAG